MTMTDKEIERVDFSKSTDFKVLGDIKPTVIKILGYYDTYMSSDCDVHLKGTSISVPAWYPYLTCYTYSGVSKEIINELLKNNLIEPVDTSIKWVKVN